MNVESQDSEDLSSDSIESRYPRGRTIAIAAIVFVVLGGALILFLPSRLLNDWVPGLTANERGKLLGTAAQIVLFSLGGLIAVVGVGLSLARHGQELQAAERDRKLATLQRNAYLFDREKEDTRQVEVERQRRVDAERALRDRFVTAVDLLSATESATKRTAGIYALAALADDWLAFGRRDEVQVCIDVLCGYLRAPLNDGVVSTPLAERAVRRTGYDLIAAHLQAHDDPPVWADFSLNLTGAHIDFDVDLSAVSLTGDTKLRFEGAMIMGTARVAIHNAIITGSASVTFDRATISDTASITYRWATISDTASITFDRATISDTASVTFDLATISDIASITFDRATISDTASITFYRATISDTASITFYRATISDTASITFDRATISDTASVTLYRAAISDTASVTFPTDVPS